MLQAVDSNHFSEVEMIAQKQVFTINWAFVIGGIYVMVCAIFLFIFIKALFKIYTLYNKNIKERFADIQLIHTDAAGTPFSFLKTIFWNIHIDVQSTTGQQILKHEIAHIQQKHSYDKLLTNLLLIVYWINPFFWLIRSELNMIHEFVADKKAVTDGDTHAFATMILKATYPTQQFILTNNFFYSPIKRRLMMITKNTTNSINYASRLLVIPIAACLFIALACKPIPQFKNPVLQKKYTVVIDAGHGGKDFGAASKTGMYEKDLTLQLAKKIKALNTNSNINIILTRDDDVYASPKEKAEFVNAHHADAMISIHVDFAPDSADIKSGSSFWVTKDEFKNTNTSKAFANTIIQRFDKDYTLQILSNAPLQRNKGIWILQASNCPAVLIEAGFLSNKKDLAFLQSNDGQQAFAKNILNGIESYFAMLVK
jgi:N-acetylmuramoyl-L-alanine amidase